jgi:CheY-like chemotaxis protein
VSSASAATPLRLLVLDDEPANNEAVLRVFRKRPEMSVTVCTSPREALEAVGRARFDIAFVDYSMAELNGLQFLQKAREQLTKTVVVMVTAYPELAAVMEARARGEVHVLLAKPWSPQDLESTVTLARSLLTLRSLRETLTPR